MSIDSTLNSVRSITNTVSSAINTVTRVGADLGLGGVGSDQKYWKDTLHPAWYRGLPFAVLGSDGHFGRRNVVHEYPYRDKVWVEDLGRSARRINMSGFLIEDSAVYGGDGVIAQRDRFIRECESPDSGGELIHPTLGTMTVSLVGSFSFTERWDRGRYFEISFAFIESGDRTFPDVQTSTGDAVDDAADAADAAASDDFVSQASAALKEGIAVVQQAVNTVRTWGSKIQRLVNDATNLYNMVGSLGGSFGRFFGGRTRGGLGGIGSTFSGISSSVKSLISLGVVARANVTRAISGLSSVASSLGL